MTALFDINVVLDVLLARKPFEVDSKSAMSAAETGLCRGFLNASAITTIHYIARKQLGTTQSLARVADLMAIFEIASINRSVLETAMRLPFSDFEDAVVHECAVQVGADCIVTRNLADFKNASILVYSPAQFLASL